jgi:hypothetical protein
MMDARHADELLAIVPMQAADYSRQSPRRLYS